MSRHPLWPFWHRALPGMEPSWNGGDLGRHSAVLQLSPCPAADWVTLLTLSLIPQKNFIAVSAANRFKKISSSGALMALGV